MIAERRSSPLRVLVTGATGFIGWHVASQLRADRSTRQLPIVLVGLSTPDEIERTDNHVTGPTRRYMLPLDTPSVLNAILAELH